MKFTTCNVMALCSFWFLGTGLFAQKQLETRISDSLTVIANSYTYIGKLKIQSLQINSQNETVTVNAGNFLAYMPLRTENVSRIYKAIRACLPEKYAGYRISCVTENRTIEELIPNYYRQNGVDSLRLFPSAKISNPLVKNLSCPYIIPSGLENRHIALWQSHGKYFDQRRTRWVWQRARIFQTVEDLYTQSYVLPFLVPMLENAGANVLLPRERDTQLHEVIVDNDDSWQSQSSRYREHNDRKSWKKTEGGFANAKRYYLQGENPFQMGTYKIIDAIPDADELSTVEWIPQLPATGEYAVYVSYKSLPNSASDAIYTVYHNGRKTHYRVNQAMGGGTWIYLGRFHFEKGRNTHNRIVLSNLSNEDGKVITADAIKIGGGMGNIARYPSTNGQVTQMEGSDSLMITPSSKKQTTFAYNPEPSGYPRYTEGARYWLQWAGVPDSVYSRTKGQNDYSDDFQSRGFWVNYLAGGSARVPNAAGLNIPVDMALAFHSDAGTTKDDATIGTLGITTIPNTWGNMFFANGASRWASRDLTDVVMTQIVDDVRHLYAPEWSRRGIWNKSYSEARVPEVPTMLLELLSHQNFSDMRYGLDPRFRFSVSRAIYKGILRYLSVQNNQPYVVQPLPVEQLSARFVGKNVIEIHWEAVRDSLEPGAMPEQYRLYTREDDGEFDEGVMVHSNTVHVTLQTGKIYSFKVGAVNKGGESFPSEIISACRAGFEKGRVMIINGFDRLAAPVGFQMDSTYAGFYTERDAGVPYISDIAYVGKQYEFKRSREWKSDDAPGFGASHADCETTEIAGNTFDFAYIHGKALKKAGYSFVSSSLKSVLNGYIDLNTQKTVDLILGKQKQTFIGNGKRAAEFKTFPLALQHSLQAFCNGGGNLLVSGAHIGSDMCDADSSSTPDRRFIEDVLHYKFVTAQASVRGNVQMIESGLKAFSKEELSYFDEPNAERYYVESPDAIDPNGNKAVSICRYSENGKNAGVAYSGSYKVCAFGFPLETVRDEDKLNKIMDNIMHFFAGK